MTKALTKLDSGRSPRALVVINSWDSVESWCDLLSLEGYEVEVATGVQDAKEKLADFAAAVALVDAHLPFSDDIKLIPSLQQLRPKPLCVVMTDVSPHTLNKGLRQDAYDYLQKPIPPDNPLATLKGCFGHIGLETQKCAVEAALRNPRQTEETLRASEALFKQDAEVVKLGYWIWDDVEDKCVYASDECAQITGVSLDEFLTQFNTRQDDVKLTHPDDRERYASVLAEAEKHAKPYDIAYKVLRPDGETRHVRERGQPVLDESGRLIQTIGSVQDITELNHANVALEESEHRLTVAARLAKLGHWHFDDIAGEYLSVSEEYAQIFGYTAEEFMERFRTFEEDMELVHPEDRAKVLEAYEVVTSERESGEGLDIDYRILRRDGAVRHLREIICSIFDDTGRVIETRGTLQDVTELKEAQLEAEQTADNLRESESRLAYAQRVAKLGTWELDPIVDEFKYSEEVLRIWGLSGEESAFTYGDMLNAIHHEDRTTVEQTLRRALYNGTAHSLEFRVVKPDDTEIVVEQKTEIVADGSGNAARMVGTIQDITERREAETRIREFAYYDNVTRLPNRALLNEHLGQALAIAERYEREVAILFIDLDHFKRINDTWGHTVGDEVLRLVALRLTESIRQCDILSREVLSGTPESPHSNTVARLGGDEFVVLLNELRCVEDAAVVARRVIDGLSAPFSVHQTEVFVTASVGISTYPNDGENTDVLLKKADAAMYEAKANGRNGYHFCTADIQARAFERLTMEANLRRALEKEQFILHYQPKIDLHDGVVGMEALVRWENPEVGMVSPADFIPIAEETGLIVPLGEWVLNKACAQTKAWQADGLESLRVSVNISIAQFRQGDLARMVSRSLAKHRLDANFLELELTESLLMDDVDTQIKILHELRDIGVQLSIDDFGTGYSSLSYLKRFPINTLKLDRSFIREMERDEDAASIVKGAISLAHNLRLRVVAEGVENQEQTNLLHEYRCDEIQGFFYSRPLASDEFAAWVRQNSKPDLKVVV